MAINAASSKHHGDGRRTADGRRRLFFDRVWRLTDAADFGQSNRACWLGRLQRRRTLLWTVHGFHGVFA